MEKLKKAVKQMLCIAMVLALLVSLQMPLLSVASAYDYNELKDAYSTKAKAFNLARDLDEGEYIRNDYVEVFINEEGHYTMGTVEGDPNSDTDNNKLLLYGHPGSSTTETLVYIDGGEYYFDNYVNRIEFNADNTECVATATIDGIEIKQILTITMNNFSGIEDLVAIKYEYTNKSGYSKNVGIRIMLDTMLGDNDGAPFRVNGEDVTYETEYSGNDIPQYWQSFDNLEEPVVTSTGFFYFSAEQKPDKVQFAYWSDIRGSAWDYQVDEDTSVTGDSAVAAYFNPRTVGSGSTNSVVTYYGISGFSSGNSDLDGELGVRVTAPSALYGSQMLGGYLNNPFAVSAYVTNFSDDTLNDVRAVISLADAPELVLDSSQASTVNLGDIYSGSGSVAQWTIRALPQNEAKTVEYSISFYKGAEFIKKMNLTLNLTELNREDAYRTVTFDLNGAEGIAPPAQEIVIGTYAEKPEDPARDGFVFGGWYSNSSCTGMPWFNIFNLYKGNLVTDNVTLYANWIENSQKIIYGKDTFSFTNSYSAFFDYDFGDYTITGDYFDILFDGLTNSERTNMLEVMYTEWGGSCFGMSAVLPLVKAGSLDVSFFQRNANTLYDLENPADNQTVFNLINYYFIMQMSNRTGFARSDYDRNNETANNKRIVDALNESNYPVLVGFNITDDAGKRVGGHAVVAYDCTASEDEFLIDIWDPNDSEYSNTLHISKDYTTSYFESTYDEYGWNSYMKYALTVEDGDYDYKNIQTELIKRGNSSGVDAMDMAMFSNSTFFYLDTNYDSFTISDSDGQTAKIVNGQKVSGDLEISDGEFLNEVGSELRLKFIITGERDSEYTILPEEMLSPVTGDEIDEYFTALSNNDEEDGFYTSLAAESEGEISIDADGKISTAFNNSTNHKVTVAANDSTTPWYAQSFEGSSTGLTVSAESDGAKITSTSDTDIEVTARNDYNTIEFDACALSSDDELVLTKSTDNDNSAVLGDQIQVIGHSLVFITSGGTAIEAQTNIAEGEYALQPENPEREGFVFSGWYTADTCADGEEWSFDTPITKDTRIYAKWLVDNNFAHTITFRAEGHDDIIISVPNNGSLDEDDIPSVPDKMCCTGIWDISDFTDITSNIIVNATYTVNHHDEIAEKDDPTCSEDGSVSYRCSECGYEHTEFVPATGHYDNDGDTLCDDCGSNVSDIVVGVSMSIDVNEGETVYLKFIPTISGRYVFESDAENDTYGYICNEDLDILRSDDDGGYDGNFRVIYNLEAGETYYLGARYYSDSRSGSFEVKLSVLPGVKDITVDDYEIIEGTNGYLNPVYDDEGYETGDYVYRYTVVPNNVTVTFDDDTIKTYNYNDSYLNDFYFDTGYDWTCSHDQYDSAQWSVGSHNVTFMAGSFTADFNIVIKESPIASITANKLTLKEGVKGNIRYSYDDDDEWNGDVWFRYSALPSSITVKYKNGTTKTYTYDVGEGVFVGFYDDTGLYFEYMDEQSSTERWTVGNKYKATFVAGMFVSEYDVEIVPATDYYRIAADQTLNLPSVNGEHRYIRFVPEYTGIYRIGLLSDNSETQIYLLDSQTKKLISEDYYSMTSDLEAGKVYYYAIKSYPYDESPEFTISLQMTLSEITGCRHPNAKSYTQQNATCTTSGYTAGKYCPDCKIWFSGHEVIPASGHNSNTIIPAVAATCTKAGLTAGRKCSGCGKIMVAQKPVSATGHKEVTIPEIAATAFSTGLTAGKKCSTCGVVTVPQQTVAKLAITVKAKNVKVADSSEITLSWNNVGSGVKYEVYQKSGKKWKKLKTTNKTSYTVKKLKADSEYQFRVRAVSGKNKSDYSKTLKVKTIPAATSLKLKAGKNQIIASWSKVSGISGYEVQYSTSKKMKSAKTTSAKSSAKKTTIKKLSKGKKYYVRVRSYKLLNGKKIYSDWSKVKNVKVK